MIDQNVRVYSFTASKEKFQFHVPYIQYYERCMCDIDCIGDSV